MSCRSVCPYDCPDACGLLVTVEAGRAIKIEADPDHPITKGLICGKMRQYQQTVHSPQRLTTPLLRTGPKGSGQFAQISWDEATQRICSRWQEIIAEHGAEAILPYSYAGTMGLVQRNSGHPFFHRLGASRLARTICTPAKDAGWKAVMGDTPALDPVERSKSDLIILWGLNAVATSIHSMAATQAARKRGAKVWAIDTYRTPTCQSADQVIIVKPGSDSALALGMLRVIVDEDLLDRSFVAANLHGFEELCATTLPECSPEAMAEVCGIPADTIRDLARAYAAAKAPLIQVGGGLTRYANGAMTIRCIACLPAAIGVWQRPGGGLFCGTSTGAAFPLHRVTREDFMTSPTRIINMNQLGNALTSLDSPPVMSLYVYHSNPAVIAPDQNAVIKGLERDDLFTVVHERFLTDTARYADMVLPATSSLEHPDLYRSYGSYQAQRCSGVIPPVGEAKSNWDTFCLLAAGMGWDEPFFKQSADDLIDQLLAEPNDWRDAAITEQLRLGEPVLMTPPTSPRGPWLTPSGKIEIRNDREPHPLPCLLPTHAEADGFPLRLQPSVSLYSLNSGFNERDDLLAKRGEPTLLMHPLDAAARQLTDGSVVTVKNREGELELLLQVTEQVPQGTVVSEGVYWLDRSRSGRGINALTSQRLTDRGEGSTLYDVAVEVSAA
ncbi:MAG: molybdopterin-dependent oxidoreductase [Trichlorobacter sp.]|uniref:molybdopterin-dependent oxidoreductase n=1 Tax=Trichlorobacter sp. TaxID=2911007 RepID=UPI00255D2163|nr:molybdopterin-dependent oxidoreductase [Trichlorobacter sp.]MDK9716691.1 molybdopterin-dependent oxidoreductase [Trichlorobacter sp.]